MVLRPARWDLLDKGPQAGLEARSSALRWAHHAAPRPCCPPEGMLAPKAPSCTDSSSFNLGKVRVGICTVTAPSGVGGWEQVVKKQLL